MKVNMNKFIGMSLIALACSTMGCSSQEVPPAHKGRMFEKTGWMAFYSGGKGFDGPILPSGTYYTGIYPEVRMVDCGERTIKEELTALTKDNIQFNLDLFIRFSANCAEDKAVEKILSTLSPAPQATPQPQASGENKDKENKNDVEHEPIEPFPNLTITSRQIYSIYIRPAIGEAVRESVYTYNANDINAKRDEMFEKIKTKYNEYISKSEPKIVLNLSLNLSNLDFPDVMEHANVDRAVQSILKDKAIAERERVTAEIETATMRKKLSEAEASQDVARIDMIGAAYHRNPEYVTIEALHFAGDKGNLILLPLNTNNIINLPTRK